MIPSSDTGLSAAPVEPTDPVLIVAALRSIPELADLSESELLWFVANGTERIGPDGTVVFTENQPAHHLNIILSGDVYVHRRNSGPVALFIGRTGRVTGKLPYSRMKTWGGSGSCSGVFWALDAHQSRFPEMLREIPSMTQRCVSILLDRVRDFARAEEQGAKLMALGKLAANLSHELNNPASAAQRAAANMSGRLREHEAATRCLGHLMQSPQELEAYGAWLRKAWERVAGAPNAPGENTLTTSDREDEILRWFEARSIPKGWTIAPALAEVAFPTAALDELATVVGAQVLPLALSNFAGAIRMERMSGTIVGSTDRIFEIVAAIQDYSYMDQAPIQDVDLGQSLENTIAMFRSHLKSVRLEWSLDPAVPAIRAFGSELNQVWTALIENALDAMQANGRLRLSTKLSGPMVFVEIRDNGHGIEPAILSRIFEPFFTTKPLGQGLGLGLDTVQRIVSKHFGSVSVESKPGFTCFQVRLPLDRMHVY